MDLYPYAEMGTFAQQQDVATPQSINLAVFRQFLSVSCVKCNYLV